MYLHQSPTRFDAFDMREPTYEPAVCTYVHINCRYNVYTRAKNIAEKPVNFHIDAIVYARAHAQTRTIHTRLTVSLIAQLLQKSGFPQKPSLKQ